MPSKFVLSLVVEAKAVYDVPIVATAVNIATVNLAVFYLMI